MIVRALDTDGDWTFGKGRNDYLSKNDAIAQNIMTRLRMFLGDCFFAVNEGIDWFNLLGGKDEARLLLAVRSTILNTEGVTGFSEQPTVSIDPLTREAFMSYKVNTVYTTGNPASTIIASNIFLLTESGDVLATESGNALAGG